MKTHSRVILSAVFTLTLGACSPSTLSNAVGTLNPNGAVSDKQTTGVASSVPCAMAVKHNGEVHDESLHCQPSPSASANPVASTQPGPSPSASPTVSASPKAMTYTKVTTFSGSHKTGFADGSADVAQFDSPGGITADANGNFYVADGNNHRIRKITPDGTVSTYAGTGKGGYADGPAAAAKFYDPFGLVFDKAGNLYVSERTNHRIRKITPGGMVSTLAGEKQGYKDGTGTEAQFYSPEGMIIDAEGNLLVADRVNHVIRKVTSAGVVTTFAGVFDPTYASGFANGTLTTAKFKAPSDLVMAPNGDIYVADTGNNRVRKISPNGDVTSVAGKVVGFKDGLGEAAEMKGPEGITLDAAGNLYTVEFNNSRLRKISPEGLVTTLSEENGNLTLNKPFNSPVKIMSYGKYLYIVDMFAPAIRRVE